MPFPKSAAAILCLSAMVGVCACKHSADASSTVAASSVPAPSYSDPPNVDLGLTVDQAYAAIPHRRTVWNDTDSPATPQEKAYLEVMFPLLDQAIAARVAGLQAYSQGDFSSMDLDAQWQRLINFARAATPPPSLTAYHQDILTALSDERQFFHEWYSARSQFPFASHIENHPSVRAASAASRAAYSELMRKFPSESPSNRDAFFDYHCALDFR